MSFFEGNGYFDNSQLVNSTVASTVLTNSFINKSSIDMLSSSGNVTNITNVADPIQPQDAATKKYVDTIGITIVDVNLSGTVGTLISSITKGCVSAKVKNLVSNGPSAIFTAVKNEQSIYGHITRVSACPGIGTTVGLDMNWNPNSGLVLFKRGTSFDGSYRVKLDIL